MPFTIPNEATASFAAQAEPDKVDFDILVAANSGTHVYSGCAVSARAIASMAIDVAAGVITNAGTDVVVAAQANLTINAADLSNARFDLIVANSSGVASIAQGTPASTAVFPAIPANSVVLAAIYVPVATTTIDSTRITDKRVIRYRNTPATRIAVRALAR